VLGCERGHRFDVNKRGYLNALDSKAGIVGDPRRVLDDRRRFLERGHYSPIADAITDALARSIDGVRNRTGTPTSALRIVDSGCGTGWYLDRVLTSRPDVTALALDASVDAVRLTVSATGAAGLVADVWRPLPVRNDAADVVMCVFAPRNPPEFARILAPGGALVVVTPEPEHLAELRRAGAMIGMQEDKLTELDRTLAAHFDLGDRHSVRYRLALSAEDADLLAGMGPTGHHERTQVTADVSVTVAVTVSVYRTRHP
jgi:23S rRNA (guanine745-N1)-methyltransferase